MRNFLCLFIGLIGFLGCSRELENYESVSLSNPQDWISGAKGFWIEYRVDTIKYLTDFGDTNTRVTSVTSYLREEIQDTLYGLDTPYQIKLVQYRKKDSAGPWLFFRNATLYLSTQYFIKTEDNLRIVKLQSPIRAGFQWKGHRYIDSSIIRDQGDWLFEYQNNFGPYYVRGMRFDSTVTVLQIADSNAIEKKFSVECYARHIGLIYSEYAILEKQDGAKPWSQPENGFILRKQILNWRR